MDVFILLTYSVLGDHFFAHDTEWNPFGDHGFKHTQISFKSIVISSTINLIVFIAKPPHSIGKREH